MVGDRKAHLGIERVILEFSENSSVEPSIELGHELRPCSVRSGIDQCEQHASRTWSNSIAIPVICTFEVLVAQDSSI